VSLGEAPKQLDLLDPVSRFCDESLPEGSIYGFLHRERDHLFPDDLFTDLFAAVGRRSVPPSVVAVVMVLQRVEGLSDREAVDRFTFDARWRYAAGVGGWDGAGPTGFAHTVLVDMRERLRRSDRPDRVFEVALTAARHAGLVGRRRVLDSTPLYDAVATMDTVTLIRSAIRGLLAVADRHGATAHGVGRAHARSGSVVHPTVLHPYLLGEPAPTVGRSDHQQPACVGAVGQQPGQHVRRPGQHRSLLVACWPTAGPTRPPADQHRRTLLGLLGARPTDASADEAAVGHLVDANTASRARGPPAP
jgi:hypothetical protein